EGFDFVRMKPDSITSTSGTMEGVSINVLSEPGVAYAIYVSMSDLQDTKLKSGEFGFKLPSGNYKAIWLNPVTGKVDKEEFFTHSGGEKKLDSPAFNPDIVLKITQTEDN
ncbi:MAG: hypothetical protein JXR65_10795, partial [Bacteroidales bacterium]|nr:hypothetical protein [Bacteroidales bacterium]